MTLRAAILGFALTAAVSASGAQASTVALVGSNEAVFTAAPGEINDFWVTDGALVSFQDGLLTANATAVIHPVAPCESGFPDAPGTPQNAASCPSGGVTVIRGLLGDGNDTGHGPTGSSRALVLDGGTGDDQLFGSERADTLLGGPGADVLAGGPGDDLLDGGPGGDQIFGLAQNPEPGATDGLDDRVTYADRTAPVTVTLDGHANDGEAGERDNVMPDVEDVVGGSAGDTIYGNDAQNTLDGGPGNDVLVALGGGADTITCGSGNDRATVDATDTVAADCETVARSSGTALTPGPGPTPGGNGTDLVPPTFVLTFEKPRLRALGQRGLALTLTTSEPASVVAELRRGGTVLGRVRGGLDRRARIVLRLNATGRKAIARAKTLRLRLVITATDSAGNASALDAGVVTFRR